MDGAQKQHKCRFHMVDFTTFQLWRALCQDFPSKICVRKSTRGLRMLKLESQPVWSQTRQNVVMFVVDKLGVPGFSMFVSRIFPYRVLAVDPWLNAHSPFSPHSAAPCPVVYQELGWLVRFLELLGFGICWCPCDGFEMLCGSTGSGCLLSRPTQPL